MKKQTKSLILVLLLLALVMVACQKNDEQSTPEPEGDTIVDVDPEEVMEEVEVEELVVMTHDSFAISEEVMAAFEAEQGIKVTIVKSGDTGSALNRAILSKEAPIADVFYGVDNTFLSRAIEEEIFEAYDSPMLASIEEQFKLDPTNQALPVDYGDVCINYDRAVFNENGIPVPLGFESLSNPLYKDMLVVQNPATSSPGLSFLLATIAYFGEDGYLEYWEALRANGVLVVNDWESAYYGSFSPYAGVESGRPLVVSYSTSPAAEVIFAAEELEESPTGGMTAPGTCFRQIEFVGILKGTEKRALAEAFIDYMLDIDFQEDIPMHMFVYPVNTNVEIPAVFEDHDGIVDQPATLDPELISDKRDEWIQAWDETVLR